MRVIFCSREVVGSGGEGGGVPSSVDGGWGLISWYIRYIFKIYYPYFLIQKMITHDIDITF